VHLVNIVLEDGQVRDDISGGKDEFGMDFQRQSAGNPGNQA
jgi:hypothetical protein